MDDTWTMLVVIEAPELTDREDCVTAGRNIGDAQETVVFLLGEAIAAAKTIGVNVMVAPLPQRGPS